jgi:cytochrome c-type biogenesis protein CcmE
MKKRQRLTFVLLILGSLALSAGIALYALRDNVSFFRTPSEARAQNIPAGRAFRLGGLVEKGSVRKRAADLTVAFTVTDMTEEMKVEYKGILPDLFREGQGVVATGSLDQRGVFVATTLLAKHDEKYMPPEIAKHLPPETPGKIKP